MSVFRTDGKWRRGGAVRALTMSLALGVAGASGAALAQGQPDSGAPVPLLPDGARGTLDPALGETDPGVGNPALGPPREIGPAPGAGVSTTGELSPPGRPPAPGATNPNTAPALAGAVPVSRPATVTQGSPAPEDAETLAKVRAAVAEATATVRELRSDSGFRDDLNDLLGRARAVAVIPSFFRAGFVVGGAYGSTLLLVRDASGAFSHPAFFTMKAGSIGFQIGIQDARIILLIMTDAGLNAILQDRFKLEAGANVTFGTVGGGMATGSTTDVNQDIVAVSHSRGLFGGGALEGAVIEPRDDWNAIYYDQPGVRPEAIVRERRVGNPASVPLIQALQDPTTGVR